MNIPTFMFGDDLDSGELGVELTAESLAESLLRQNFLPRQAPRGSEMPPSIISTSFTLEVARAILAQGRGREHDAMPYRLTRFDLTLRHALVPHPAPYARLVCGIADHWEKFSDIADNPSSVLRPMLHPDGRVFVMSGYGEALADAKLREGTESFGSQFVVHTDIKNFYPSIYSHAIAWALAPNKIEAKQNRDGQVWFNQIDALFRWCRRNETNGVPIGPGTSNIASEIILGRVDQGMRDNGYTGFVRYIDDYTFYAKSQEEARAFIRDLQNELLRFELHLNGTKTKITPLPVTTRLEWISQLVLNRPGPSETIDGVRAYLDLALELATKHPSGSVLRYAFHVIASSDLPEGCLEQLAQQILNLSFHWPVLVPTVAEMFERDDFDGSPFAQDLNSLACEFVRNRQTDATCWVLDVLLSNGLEVAASTIGAIIAAEDCVPLTLLYAADRLNAETVQKLVSKIFETGENYDQDQWWMLLFEIFLDSPDLLPQHDSSFEVLRDYGVHFVDRIRLGSRSHLGKR